MPGPALIVGLGNPGPEYERTRHNIGFRVVDSLCARFGVTLRAARGMRALTADARDGDRKIILAEPTTFMNLSGEAVGELARYYKVELDDIVIVHDDVDLPLGTLKIKRGGGDGGHNGLKHITRALGSPMYARVRIGVGRPPGRQDTADYVLKPFTKAEQADADVMVERAADVTMDIARDGFDAAQTKMSGAATVPKARAIRAHVTVDAPRADVWRAWTTDEGARTFFAPDSRIVLEQDGPYELYFDLEKPPGLRGSEGCTVLTIEPERHLAFSWNAPPEIPGARNTHTRVDIALRNGGKDKTKVALTHSGWGEGPEWDEAFAYFERAWDLVLSRLRDSFADGPVDWSA